MRDVGIDEVGAARVKQIFDEMPRDLRRRAGPIELLDESDNAVGMLSVNPFLEMWQLKLKPHTDLTGTVDHELLGHLVFHSSNDFHKMRIVRSANNAPEAYLDLIYSTRGYNSRQQYGARVAFNKFLPQVTDLSDRQVILERWKKAGAIDEDGRFLVAKYNEELITGIKENLLSKDTVRVLQETKKFPSKGNETFARMVDDVASNGTKNFNKYVKDKELRDQVLKSVKNPGKGFAEYSETGLRKAERFNYSFDSKRAGDPRVEQLETELAIAREALEANPARALSKYVSRSTGELPEITGTPTRKSLTGSGKTVKNSLFGRTGDDIVTELGFEDGAEAQKAFEEYTRQKAHVEELENELRTGKLRRTRERIQSSSADSVRTRRLVLRALQRQMGLSDSDLRQISKRDLRLMDTSEFANYLDKIELKAVELADTRQAKAELMQVLRDKELKREENYRKTQGFPPLSRMTATQMRTYAEALEAFEVGDEFLTLRQLEVVDRTDLRGIKTTREALERLVKRIKEDTGKDVTIAELEAINVSPLDKLRHDTSLYEKNPYYGFVVERTHTHILEGEASYLNVQERVMDLARKANASRTRNPLQRIRQALIPKHEAIVRYLEASGDEKAAYLNQLTKEEMDYAHFVEQYYKKAYEHLVSIKELYGSRFADNYFTHTRKQFLEKWSDDGFLAAVKNLHAENVEERMVANIIDQDTGQILPKSKFFQYTLRRNGAIDPSQNVTRVFLQYAKQFERKRMFDQMIPELDIYTQSLTPKNLTPHGLEMDRRLKTFMNEYLNNKKGRKVNFSGLVPQGGGIDVGLRLGNMAVSLMDLGFNIGASVAATVGEQMMTYQALGKIKYARAWKRRVWDTGLLRMKDKNAGKILSEAEPFIGRNIWTELRDADQGIADRVMTGIYGAFATSSVEANKLFLLGTISKAELRSGKLSSKRLAELRLEAGRWRDMGRDVKSIVGSTSVGSTVTKYKDWAIPILRTTENNVRKLASKIKQKKFGEAIKSREVAELYRAIETIAILLVVRALVLGEEDDQSFVGKLKARVYQEAMTFLGGTDPTVFLSTPRILSFLQQFAENLKKIAALETYNQDSQWGSKGDLTGARGLQRQLTPAAIRQFRNATNLSDEEKIIKEERQKDTDAREATTESAEKTLERMEGMSKEQAKEMLKALAKEEPETVKKVLELLKDTDSDLSDVERQLKAAGIESGARARSMHRILEAMDSDAEKKERLKEWAAKDILTTEVLRQLLELKGE